MKFLIFTYGEFSGSLTSVQTPRGSDDSLRRQRKVRRIGTIDKDQQPRPKLFGKTFELTFFFVNFIFSYENIIFYQEF